jgi:hypothetical protein
MGKTNQIWLWNKIMGHMNFGKLVKINTKQALRDMPKIKKQLNTIYQQCHHGQISRMRFKIMECATSKTLELVHTNIYGPTRTKNMQGENYVMLLIDDYTRINEAKLSYIFWREVIYTFVYIEKEVKLE